MMKNVTKVLQVCSSMNAGGVETFLYNYYKMMDKTKVTYDFAVYTGENGIYRNIFEELNSKVYKLPSKKYILSSIVTLRKLIENNNYDIVHIHLSYKSLIPLIAAKKSSNKPKIIVHYHLANYKMTFRRKICNYFITKKTDIIAACSNDALANLNIKNKRKIIIYNAIDYKKFMFRKEYRDEWRNKLNISDECVCIGTVGRITEQKNPNFILKIIAELSKRISNFKFIYVGSGDLNEAIKQRAISMNIQDKIIFTGAISNVNEIYNCFDAFIFPSLYEGLGITVVESQTNGLKTYVSSGIPLEANFSGNVFYIDLKENESSWCDLILKNGFERNSFELEKLKKYNFSIEEEAKKIESLYLRLSDME